MKRKSAVINVGVVTQKKVMYYTVLYFLKQVMNYIPQLVPEESHLFNTTSPL